MNINFILFNIYIENYSIWSNLKVTKDNYETIVDFGYWRFYFSWLLTVWLASLCKIKRQRRKKKGEGKENE